MLGIIAAVFLLLALRLVQVQVLNGGRYAAYGQAETASSITLPALRGTIYDRSGNVLAMSVARETIVGDPHQVADPRGEAARLAPVVGVAASQLEKLLSENAGFVYLAQQVTPQVADAVAKLKLPGITEKATEGRVDPPGSLDQAIVGSVGIDSQPLSGLEYQDNKLLAGSTGEEVVNLAPGGIVLPGSRRVSRLAHAGDGLLLTIDDTLQYQTMQALQAQVASSGATYGTAIIMDPNTGAILAMANVAGGANGTARPATENYAVTRVFEPGSVFKIVTFGTALQDGLITPTTTFSVPNQYNVGGALFHDAETHPTEQLTATQIIAQSSNIGTIKIAQMLGKGRLAAAISNFGFGEPTGLGFPGESWGIVRPVWNWSATAIGSTPIGQDDAVTALQALDMMNCVANGGYMIRPSLVQSVVAPDGTKHAVAATPRRRILSTTTARTLATMLEQVVKVGTGVNAVVPGYTVAGKTGTANIPNHNGTGYAPGAFMATFAGFAPAQHPALSAIVVLDRPRQIYGGAASAPVFATIMQDALQRFGIPPSSAGAGSTTVNGVTPAAPSAPSSQLTRQPSPASGAHRSPAGGAGG